MTSIDSTPAGTTTATLSGERADLLATLRGHRHFLRFTARGLTDEQACARTTASELTIGGLIKHVAHTEENWLAFAREGTSALAGTPEGGSFEDGVDAHVNSFRLLAGETLQGVLDFYEQVAAATDELVATVPDLDVSYPLPEAPWFPPGAGWSIRRVLLHIIAETSQHAGHADIVRESLDGQKTMG
jgi:uncharacterized damage-inducible protein DinB